jgi:hypothetical protein
MRFKFSNTAEEAAYEATDDAEDLATPGSFTTETPARRQGALARVVNYAHIWTWAWRGEIHDD